MSMNIMVRSFYKVCENISNGTLHVTAPDGSKNTFGNGKPEAAIHIHDWKFVRVLMARGDIGFGESYTEGLWDSPNIENLIRLILENDTHTFGVTTGSRLQKLAFLMKDRLLRRNSRSGSKKNISAHYDVGNDFYSLWLDETMTYSSALYLDDNESLETAQHNKYDRLIKQIGPDQERVLEIGCGWGGFAERAVDTGLNVTAITVSNAQKEFAQNRLGKRADIQLTDYRDIKGKFDAIVSIEMVEAVGMRYWPEYFKTLKSRLADGGRAAIQSIIVEDEYFDHYKSKSDYIRQYTFPGGMLINPASIEQHAKAAGLKTENMHRFGQDYARTLREWMDRFNMAEDKIRALGYDETFMRSWRYYLQLCAASFANNKRTNVVHVEFCHA